MTSVEVEGTINSWNSVKYLEWALLCMDRAQKHSWRGLPRTKSSRDERMMIPSDEQHARKNHFVLNLQKHKSPIYI
jgi:hypothetical protein